MRKCDKIVECAKGAAIVSLFWVGVGIAWENPPYTPQVAVVSLVVLFVLGMLVSLLSLQLFKGD